MNAMPQPPADDFVKLTPREREELGRLRAIKNRAYRATPLGLYAGRYIRWMKTERGATKSTMIGYEAVVADLCVRWGDQPVEGLEPPAGTEFIRGVIDDRYGHLSPGSRRKATFILHSFFEWLTEDAGALHGDPARRIRAPKKRDADRDLFSLNELKLISMAAPHGPRPDRAAVEILISLAVRKGALQGFQLGHYDADSGNLKIVTKGGTRQLLPVTPYLAAILDAHWQTRRDRNPKTWRLEYLLYREHVVPTNRADGSQLDMGDRLQPKSDAALHAWWKARVLAAGVPYRSMHSVRHTRLTQVTRSSKGGLKQAQLLAGHKSITTTGDIYARLDIGDVLGTLIELDAER